MNNKLLLCFLSCLCLLGCKQSVSHKAPPVLKLETVDKTFSLASLDGIPFSHDIDWDGNARYRIEDERFLRFYDLIANDFEFVLDSDGEIIQAKIYIFERDKDKIEKLLENKLGAPKPAEDDYYYPSDENTSKVFSKNDITYTYESDGYRGNCVIVKFNKEDDKTDAYGY